MTDQFGTGGDSTQNTDDGTNFGQTDGTTEAGATENQGITSEDLAALRVRDEAAQAHIPNLESENNELRNKVVELEDKLTSATTLDEALDRISKTGTGDKTSGLDAGAVTQIVDQVLTQKQTESTKDSNWATVEAKLTNIYGDWETADTKVFERAKELDIDIADATTMAKNNPKAFLQLFTPQQSTNTDSSSGVRSGGSGQTVASGAETGSTRDAAYYNNLRKTNAKEYWKVETQAQYRRDVHGET